MFIYATITTYLCHNYNLFQEQPPIFHHIFIFKAKIFFHHEEKHAFSIQYTYKYRMEWVDSTLDYSSIGLLELLRKFNCRVSSFSTTKYKYKVSTKYK